MDKFLGGSGRIDRKLAPAGRAAARLGPGEGFAALARAGETCVLPDGAADRLLRGGPRAWTRTKPRYEVGALPAVRPETEDPAGEVLGQLLMTVTTMRKACRAKGMTMSSIPERADVVVVGSGATGLAAAVTLAEGGAKVVVFEKQRSLGGTSNFFQGTFAVESDMQRERYIDYTRDQAFKNTMDYSHWRANPRLVRAIVDESGPTISWLQEPGRRLHRRHHQHARLAAHLSRHQGQRAKRWSRRWSTRPRRKGAQSFPAPRSSALLKEGGRISGVIVDDDGEEVEVAAKAVVIASGGFANNKEWIKKYTGYDLGVNLIPVGNTGKTGDGLRMAWEVGRRRRGRRAPSRCSGWRRWATSSPWAATWSRPAAQPDLWVTARGERFCDETIGFYDTPGGQRPGPLQGGRLHLQHLRRLHHRAAHWSWGLDKGVGVDFPPGYQADRSAQRDPGRSRQRQQGSVRGRLGRGAGGSRSAPTRPCCGPPWTSTTATARRATTSSSPRTAAFCGPCSDPGSTPSGAGPSSWAPWAASRSTSKLRSAGQEGHASSPACTPAASTPAACTATATPSRVPRAWPPPSRSTRGASPGRAPSST